MKLIFENLAQDDYTNISASSQDAFFPVANIKNQHRAKEWRSAGYYKVAGSTAIANGTYSRQELLDELNAETAPTVWTYNQNTGRFKATRVSTFAFNDAVLDVLGFNGALSGLSVYEAPRVAIHTEEFVTFDLRTAETMDTVALLWAKNRLMLSSVATLTLEASATANFSSVGFSQPLTIDERLELVNAFFAPQHFRYWRIKIVDPENANLFVSIGTVVLGQADEVLNTTSNGFDFGVKDFTLVSTTAFGQSYYDVLPQLKTFKLNFDLVENPEASRLLNLFSSNGVSKPVFIVLDAFEETLTTDFWIYGTLSSGLGLSHKSLAYFSSSLTIEESN